MKYTKVCYNELHDLYQYPLPDMRKAVITAVSQLCRGTHKLTLAVNDAGDAKQGKDPDLNETMTVLFLLILDNAGGYIIMILK